MRLGIPGIKLCSDGRYKLYCGCCGHTDVELREIQKDIYGNSLCVVYCKSHCNSKDKEKDNVVCSIPNIREFAKRDCNGDMSIYYKMIIDVYTLLKINLYYPKDFRALVIEKELTQKLNSIKIGGIEYLGEEEGLGSLRYLCTIGNKKYLIRVRTDGNVFAIETEKFKGNNDQWSHLDGILIKVNP